MSAPSVITDINGLANTILHLANVGGDVQVSVCVAPANLPCQIFSATAVPSSALRLQPVQGTSQMLPVGQPFEPVTVRVTDSSTPDHPILGANVAFDSVVSRPAPAPLPISIGGIVITRNPAPVIVSSSRSSVLSDISGLATLQPFLEAAQGPTLIQGSSAAGISTISFSMQSLRPVQQASPRASPGASLRGTGAAGTSFLTNLDRPQPRPQTNARHR